MDVSSLGSLDKNSDHKEDINEIYLKENNCENTSYDFEPIYNPLDAKVHIIGSTAHFNKNTKLLRLSVRDNGSGIPETSITKVFDVK